MGSVGIELPEEKKTKGEEKMKQIELANQLGISKSYLSMILSRQRKCPPELLGKLQSIPGVHKVVNNGVYEMPSKQVVAGSSPVSRSTDSANTSFSRHRS